MSSKTDEASFENKLKELESILEWFDSDSTNIDESLSKFERGMVLSSELKKHLDQVENKVQKIKAKFSE